MTGVRLLKWIWVNAPKAFIVEMGPALAAADVVVSRAGAIALSEFCFEKVYVF